MLLETFERGLLALYHVIKLSFEHLICQLETLIALELLEVLVGITQF